jgi:hypothetical protein
VANDAPVSLSTNNEPWRVAIHVEAADQSNLLLAPRASLAVAPQRCRVAPFYPIAVGKRLREFVHRFSREGRVQHGRLGVERLGDEELEMLRGDAGELKMIGVRRRARRNGLRARQRGR